MTGVRERILHFLEQVMFLAYLNVLWIAFTLLGLVVGGFFPSTAAMYTIIRRWHQQGSQLDSQLVRVFWQEYKTQFLSANLYGYAFFICGSVLVLDLFIFASMGTVVGYIVTTLLTTLLIVFLFMCVFCFPIFVWFEGSTLQLIKKTVRLAIPCIPYALLSIFLSALLGLVLFFIPAAVLFFSGSVIAFINFKLFSAAFSRLQEKHLHHTNPTLRSVSP